MGMQPRSEWSWRPELAGAALCKVWHQCCHAFSCCWLGEQAGTSNGHASESRVELEARARRFGFVKCKLAGKQAGVMHWRRVHALEPEMAGTSKQLSA